MGFFDEEPTFTVEEFVYSWVPGVHWFDPTIENLGYTTAKLGVLVLPLAAKAAWIYKWGLTAEVIALHGGRWQAAGYLATQESYGLYSMFKKASRIVNPVFLVGGTAIAAQYHTLTSPPPTEALRSEPGQTSWWRAVAQALVGTGPGVGSYDVTGL